MGFLDSLAEVLSRAPGKRAEYGPMSDSLAKQNASYGVTGGLLNTIDPYILDWKNSPEHQFARGKVGFTPEVADRIGGGVIGTFGGINAKTADLVALKKAEALAAKGVDNEAVRQATGWFKGMDDKWRFEIPDNTAEFKTRISKSRGFAIPNEEYLPSGARGRLGQTLNHEDLFAAYPDLANVYVDTPFGVTAQRSPSGQYYQEQTFFPEKIEVNSKLMSDKQKSMEALLHEVEHAVQAREGFTPGGSIRGMSMKDYQHIAGEIEARDVSARMNLTPEQRLATPPDLRPDAIVRYGNGPQMSVPGYVEDAATKEANFKKWFGDSKVVDAEGKPLTVYHGTKGDFDTLQPSRGGEYGSGVYLTADPGASDMYAARAFGDGGAKSYPVHINLENPYYAKERDTVRGLGVKKLKKLGHDGIIAEGPTGEVQYIAFDPPQIKSIFNRGTYDKSGNILKSLIPAAATAYGIDQVLPYD